MPDRHSLKNPGSVDSWKAADTSTRVEKHFLECMEAKDIRIIGRYYATDKDDQARVLTKAEVKIFQGSRSSVFTVFQNQTSKKGPVKCYFTKQQAIKDAKAAYGQAREVGIGSRPTIWFSIDRDILPADIGYIKDYIDGLVEQIPKELSDHEVFNLGVYGSGYVLQTIMDHVPSWLVVLPWLAFSTGWRDYQKFKDSGSWVLLQTPESNECSFQIDRDTAQNLSPVMWLYPDRSFPGLGYINAALMRLGTDWVYFFSEDYYIRYSLRKKKVDPGYPKLISSGWRGMPDRFNQEIDAALYRKHNNSIYFFKGHEYVRFSSIEDGMDGGYPKRIADHWRGMPDRFNQGIDAALYRKHNNSIYFFKGHEYVRFSKVRDGMDDGYPKRIADHWRGMPDNFNSRIDAALCRPDNGKIYFFTRNNGNQYVRFSKVIEGMDKHYPKPFAKEWYFPW